MEKRAVRHAAMLSDHPVEIYSLTLQNLLANDDRARNVPADACPVGTVEFVSAWARTVGVNLPQHMSYPECLMTEEFLHRPIREGVFADVQMHEFAKPRHVIKGFTGALRHAIEGAEGIGTDFQVWIAAPVNFVSEWRFYVSDGQLLGAGRYDEGEDGAPEPEISKVAQAVKLMGASMPSVISYALDFGVLADGRTALVEANDAFALGYYAGSCSPRGYAALLWGRWQSILAEKLGQNETNGTFGAKSAS